MKSDGCVRVIREVMHLQYHTYFGVHWTSLWRQCHYIWRCLSGWGISLITLSSSKIKSTVYLNVLNEHVILSVDIFIFLPDIFYNSNFEKVVLEAWKIIFTHIATILAAIIKARSSQIKQCAPFVWPGSAFIYCILFSHMAAWFWQTYFNWKQLQSLFLCS